MPRIPRNPIDDFLDGLREVFLETMETVVDQATENVRSRVPRGTATSPKPLPRTKKQKSGRVPADDTPTHYDTLEVSERASQETIAAAFRSLSSRFHPDKVAGKERQMREVTAAYSILKDKDKRREYDRKIGVGK